jgi:hypothetical protein
VNYIELSLLFHCFDYVSSFTEMQKFLVPIAFIAVSASANAISLVTSSTFNGKTYSVYSFGNGPTDWGTANTFANGLGGGAHLATITDAAEDAFVGSLVANSGFGELWLGAFQDGTETSASTGWQWVTNEAFSYTNWNNGEPNDFYGYQSEQHLAMWSFGKWNDEGALGNVGGFVTEAVPEPTSMVALAIGAAAMLRRRKKA